eukprot:Skav212333  [mRNA]  locus=scaffold3374:233677:233907:+ [translate_table: standard]
MRIMRPVKTFPMQLHHNGLQFSSKILWKVGHIGHQVEAIFEILRKVSVKECWSSIKVSTPSKCNKWHGKMFHIRRK